MKMNEYGVIFDMDGVIADTETIYYESMKTLAKRRGNDFTLELKKEVMGRGGIFSMRIMKASLGLTETPEELLEERWELCRDIVSQRGVKPMPGALKTIKLVNKLGLKKIIASSSQRRWVDLILNGLKLIDEFSIIASGDEVSVGKPAPDVFLLALKKLGLESNKCVVLEDTVVGVEAAHKAQIKCIAIPNKYNIGVDFSSADVVIKSLNDMNEELLKEILGL